MAYLDPAAALMREARSTAGAPTAGTDEVQTITIGGTPTGGSFTLTFEGVTSAAIDWSATNNTLVSNIDAALEAMSNIGTGNVTTAVATMTAGIGTITVTFVGALAKKAVGLMVATSSLVGTNPTVAVTETTPGVNASYRGAPIGAITIDVTNGVPYSNTGTAIVPTWTKVGAQ